MMNEHGLLYALFSWVSLCSDFADIGLHAISAQPIPGRSLLAFHLSRPFGQPRIIRKFDPVGASGTRVPRGRTNPVRGQFHAAAFEFVGWEGKYGRPRWGRRLFCETIAWRRCASSLLSSPCHLPRPFRGRPITATPSGPTEGLGGKPL